MPQKHSLTHGPLPLLLGSALLTALAGCVEAPSAQRGYYPAQPVGQPAQMVVYQDDYDYYPGYEVYYSRNRREYVYRDGNRWVRGREPRGISLSLLLASPSVRVDFHDEPERHHESIVRTYPRNYGRPAAQVYVQPPAPVYVQPAPIQVRPAPIQVQVVVQNDYEYYPGYETYYSRSRNEYVYREGPNWVHRSEPRGIPVNVLRAAPSVHLEINDAPEKHHGETARRYPKNWQPPGKGRDDKDDRKDDRDDRRDDRNDDKRDNRNNR